MYNRALVIAPVVIGVAMVIVLILIANISNATVALPLTIEGMLKKAEALPEAKAFQEKYPNNSFTAGNKTSDKGDGYVKFTIGNWAVQDRTRHGLDRFDNRLELLVLFNRTSGEIVEMSLQCIARLYHTEFGGSLVSEPDPDKSFHLTSSEDNILQYIQQGRDEQCFATPQLYPQNGS